MRPLVLLATVLALAGCDAALDPLGGSTDPADLRLGAPWIATEAVVDGDRVRFPEAGYTLAVEEATLGGQAEPNHYSAQRYEAGADGSFRADDVITTLVGGNPEAERRQNALLTALTTATRFEVTDTDLALYGPDGDGVRFRR